MGTQVARHGGRELRVAEYQAVVVRLLSKRELGITSDEEGEIAEQLDGIWNTMCFDDQLEIDIWVRKVVGV